MNENCKNCKWNFSLKEHGVKGYISRCRICVHDSNTSWTQDRLEFLIIDNDYAKFVKKLGCRFYKEK